MRNYSNGWQKILAMIRRRFFPTRTERMRDICARLGQRGEEAAVRYLLNSGYEILSRNYLAPHGIGELDIVARNLLGHLCIVEVKTRRERSVAPSICLYEPRFAVNSEKKRRLLRSTQSYLRETHFRKNPQIRYDIIEVWAKDGTPERLRHWPSAFTHS